MNKFTLSFKSPAEMLKYIETNDVQFIDLNFTNLDGKWMHMSIHASCFSKDHIEKGTVFSGRSMAGWCETHETDMIVKPDITRAAYDPFSAQKTIKIFCDVFQPNTNEPYNRDPRSIAKAAEKYLKKTGIGDTIHFGPEPEFFVFDDVRVSTSQHNVSYIIESDEEPHNKAREYPTGNMGHRPMKKHGYIPERPLDSLSDIRAEMLTVIESMGIAVEKHHHEAAPAQCELGIEFGPLLQTADNIQIYKHAVFNVAHSYGKTATFMPKPLNDAPGSGMHVHQSIWKAGKNLFAGSGYSGLSETALYYIGGLLKHAKTVNAFTNPSTNSYKRMTPGFSAPIALTYSASNRSAACRIPPANTPEGSRVEARFPDGLANPYLALSAMLMAGLDGIDNKIHPGEAIDKDLFQMTPEELSEMPKTCSSFREALEALAKDHAFLLKGDVFTLDMINAYIEMKMEEVERYESTPHPVEVDMYYSS
ncbi:MAG: type I glutamate--ammonia ligase [Alphaproteobacteria bacterium]|nr:type I glutamate--ammonia ligase [Alphaproteobacteria bacterium]